MDRFIKYSEMKNIILFSLMFISNISFTQITSDFSFQGLLLNADGSGIENKEVEFIISISSGDMSSSVYYSESQMATTDDNGVFNFVVGEGVALVGSMADINWLAAVPNIEIQYDLGNGEGMQSLGKTKFQSVPFAFYSKYVVCQDGPAGYEGDPGPQGPTGPDGLPGMVGASNIAGSIGARGPSGRPITPMLSEVPSSGFEGTVYLDDGTNREDDAPGFRYFDGAVWIDL